MDKQTLAYYSAHATDVAQRYESTGSALSSYFAISFLHEGKILDVGCGSGRDLALLASLGFDAYANVDAKELYFEGKELDS
jgi:2-polyprenyl-3-methyl-5-hydroxy-6-metoxy-1,4-benzoquinol methylase